MNVACDTDNHMDDVFEWLTLYLTPGLGPAACSRLVEHFGSPHAVLAASEKSLAEVQVQNREGIKHLLKKTAGKEAEKELNKARQMGVHILSIHSPQYPQRLKNIHNPPIILYVKGDVSKLYDMPLLAIVGSRAATSYGRRISEALASALAQKGFGIVSGLALGIDAAAHQGALSCDGVTIGVLGCGLDIIYPVQNKNIFKKIEESGVLISEYTFGTKPDHFRFPARNRIICGLSMGVVVVEASRNSGSLITAKLALEQGREIFAVPGRIDSIKSEGTHSLIKDGAKLVHHVDDILEEFSHQHICTLPPKKAQVNELQDTMNELELLIYEQLDVYPMTIDEIIQKTDLNVKTVNELLLHLELKGIIEALPGKQYKKWQEQ